MYSFSSFFVASQSVYFSSYIAMIETIHESEDDDDVRGNKSNKFLEMSAAYKKCYSINNLLSVHDIYAAATDFVRLRERKRQRQDIKNLSDDLVMQE